jgi:hypothetical protein
MACFDFQKLFTKFDIYGSLLGMKKAKMKLKLEEKKRKRG